MKNRWITRGLLVSAVLLIPGQTVYARTAVTCHFSWDENAAANIKGHSQQAVDMKKVSTKEYEQLVGKKIAARVKGSGGAKCTLEHPNNKSIQIQIRKDEFRLDPAGAMPDCNLLQATVLCEGMEKPAGGSEHSAESDSGN